MFDLFSGKFELRMWLGMLLLASTILLSVSGDQVTFVRPPENNFERLLTVLPTITYYWSANRSTCFILSASFYGGALGATSYFILIFLEQKVFEPFFFKRMVQTKLREEKLFNQYMNKFKP